MAFLFFFDQFTIRILTLFAARMLHPGVHLGNSPEYSTVKTPTKRPCVRTVGPPFLARSGVFSFLSARNTGFLVFAPFLKEEILDYLAHGLFVRVLTVIEIQNACM